MGKKIILLSNLGSPDSYQVKDVRSYLKEFLMDGRVIDVPYLLRTFLVKGIIVPFRAPASAEKYRTIWTDKGSPLVITTAELAKALENESESPVYYCMRYGNPTVEDVLKKIYAEHDEIDELVLFPLYPHYAMSSYETAVEHVRSAFAKGNYTAKLKVIDPYFDDTKYIDALAASMEEALKKSHDHFVFSYHGVPERHITKTDCTGTHCLKVEDCCHTPSDAHAFCYRHQVIRTTELLADKLKLKKEDYTVCFQSRLGRDKWLSPDTASVLANLPAKGKKRIIVICPAFVSDCLETLEEIQMEGRESFMHNGGESFEYVSCLNTDAKWIEAIDSLIKA